MRFRAREVLRAIGKKCRRENLAFDLTVEWLSQKFEAGTCELTGLAFNLDVSARRSNAFTPSVDRIDPKNGYTRGNCRVVLMAVNAAMSDWGLDVALVVSEALLKRHSRKDLAA